MSNITRPTWAEINLDNLAFNLNSARDFIGKDKQFMAVVKADAYGHNSVRCAKKLEETGIDWFGVALPAEGMELRQAGIQKRILCLGGYWKGQEEDLLDNGLTPVIFDLERARDFDHAAGMRNVEAPVHIKIDTGMGRVGVPFDKIEDFAVGLSSLRNIKVEGAMTHFAVAEDLSQTDFTNEQIKRFETAIKIFENHGIRPQIRDLANSPGAVAHSRGRGNLVRLGGMIYGLADDVLPRGIDLPVLRPVMSLYSSIAFLKDVPKGSTLGYGRTFTTQRDSRIATIPIGYQDGYMRALSNKATALIKGKRVRVVGRVSMDWTILDVTGIEDVDVGDKVTLIGREGDEEVTAPELAGIAGTISYELTCGINSRVKRVFIEN